MKLSILIALAISLLLASMVIGRDYSSVVRLQATDGTTDRQTFGLKYGLNLGAANFVYGKDGAAFWYRLKQGSTWWAIPIKATKLLIEQPADSVEITAASADSVFILTLH